MAEARHRDRLSISLAGATDAAEHPVHLLQHAVCQTQSRQPVCALTGRPSDDFPIGHVAFAFADLDPILERADALGAERVREPALDEQHGFLSAFVRAPNKVLIELVEAGEVPNP